MNILMFSEYFPSLQSPKITGGVEARAYNIVINLPKENNIIVLSSKQDGMKNFEKKDNIKIYRLHNLPYTNRGNIFTRLILIIKMVFFGFSFKKEIDVVEGCSFLMYIPSFFYAKLIGSKSIITYHELWINKWIKYKGIFTGVFGELWERIALLLPYDTIFCNSESTKKDLIKYGINEHKLKVITNGVNIELINEIKSEKVKYPQICYVGRLIKTKQIDVLIKSISQLKNDFDEIKCVICGSGPELENLKQLVEKLDLVKNIQFTGYIDDYSDVVKIIKNSHLFCHPSGVEGFGIVLIEAMASGTPVVTSDIKPFIEINSIETGRVFPLGNYHDLAFNLKQLLKNEVEYEKCQLNCIKKASNYNWKKITNDFNNELVHIITRSNL